ncbi:hypothetical protein QFZ31_006708 [Neobacillus niacini]|uniref:hypothetical protein n=1 Tax=Neobacillus driksii TaxID=3035913 RepID=UPI00278626E8|nr:hypothetical protein [Neobacillus niacini]MDQ0976656.1 hypothetical protein [Neobacillus niacini]
MEMQVMGTGSFYTYWEVFRWAEDGDVFEIVDCPNNDFEGSRVVMKKQGGYGVVMKHYGSYGDDSSDTLVTPYGAITGSTFKRVDAFEKVDFRTAFDAIRTEGHEVYVKKYGEFEVFGRFTDFSDHYITDLDDLINADFYMKTK